ncbi:hypothetical protein Q3G72_033127 [Acer saccharum]|nr:hypothetical protein Q3G72_033127 [Acer saccharum]
MASETAELQESMDYGASEKNFSVLGGATTVTRPGGGATTAIRPGGGTTSCSEAWRWSDDVQRRHGGGATRPRGGEIGVSCLRFDFGLGLMNSV